MKGRLFFKLLLSYLAIIVLSFLILNSFIRDELSDVLTGKMERELLTYARLLDLKAPAEMAGQISKIADLSQSRVTVIDAKGAVLADSHLDASKLNNHLNRPEVQEARVRGEGRASRYSASDKNDIFYVAVAVKNGETIDGYIRLSRTLDDVKNTVEEVYGAFLIALVLTSFLSLVLSLIFAHTIARPIRLLESFTEKLRRGEPSGTILLKTSDETKVLADNLNYLVEALQAKIRAANEEKSKLMAALTNMTEGVLILDALEKIEFVSPMLSGILVEQYGDMEGKTLLEAFRNAELHQAFHQFKLKREPVSAEITLGGLDPVFLNISISEIRGYPGEEKFMIVFHDVTRLKKLERIRTDFVANVTHEIRTPLAAIIGYLETLQAGAIEKPDDARRFVEIMLKQSHRLNRLVEDLMTISRIELGDVTLQLDAVSLPEALDNAVALVEPKAAAKKLTLSNRLSNALPPVKADRDRLSQILLNILDNAVKFTPEGGSVIIDAEVKGERVALTIEDTGIGVPREELQRLGERFYRVDKTRSRELGGTGLGLSIVKHLMTAHGGSLTIESQPGRGTKVILLFPISQN